jgi:hypothetical protein
MDSYRQIEIKIAEKHGAVAKGTRKSIGDFLLNNNLNQPVNVKSSNLDNNNYSPNIISAKRLINWVKNGNELYFIFVKYRIKAGKIVDVEDSGLVPFYHISWNCLTIEAQGWGVIQMYKPLELNEKQTMKEFFSGMRAAYEKYMMKEEKKLKKIKEMIKDF